MMLCTGRSSAKQYTVSGRGCFAELGTPRAAAPRSHETDTPVVATRIIQLPQRKVGVNGRNGRKKRGAKYHQVCVVVFVNRPPTKRVAAPTTAARTRLSTARALRHKLQHNMDGSGTAGDGQHSSSLPLPHVCLHRSRSLTGRADAYASAPHTHTWGTAVPSPPATVHRRPLPPRPPPPRPLPPRPLRPLRPLRATRCRCARWHASSPARAC